MLTSYQIILALSYITAIQTMKLGCFACLRSCISDCADCCVGDSRSNAVTKINFTSISNNDDARAPIPALIAMSKSNPLSTPPLAPHEIQLQSKPQSSSSSSPGQKVNFFTKFTAQNSQSTLVSGLSILKPAIRSPSDDYALPFPLCSYIAPSPPLVPLLDTFPRIPPAFHPLSRSSSSFPYTYQYGDFSVTTGSSASTISLFSSPNPLERMYAATEIGSSSEYKLISGIDCESIINLIPIGMNKDYEMHPFWLEQSITGIKGMKEYITGECWNRFHELHDLDVAQIQMQALEAKKNKGAESDNLVVFHLEKTVLDYDIDICAEDRNETDLSQIAKQYNYDQEDLVFAYINLNETERVEDQFADDKDEYFVMFRPGLMKLLHDMVCGEIADNNFDFMVFIGNNPYVSFFNIILIEMYFNWYYLLTQDPLLSVERHHQLMFRFEFVIPMFKRSKYKKSLHAIDNILHKTINVYDRLLIIDYNDKEWDPRFPKSPHKLWKNVFAITASKRKSSMSSNATTSDLPALGAKRDRDTFLVHVEAFIADIKQFSELVLNHTNGGWLVMDWIKIGRTVRIIRSNARSLRSGTKLRLPPSRASASRASGNRTSSTANMSTIGTELKNILLELKASAH